MSEPFNTILEEIASELELRPLLTSIITRACELLGADGGSIGLYVPRRHTVQVEAIHQLPLTELGLEFEPGEGLIGKVLATGPTGHRRSLRRAAADFVARDARLRRHWRADSRAGRRLAGRVRHRRAAAAQVWCIRSRYAAIVCAPRRHRDSKRHALRARETSHRAHDVDCSHRSRHHRGFGRKRTGGHRGAGDSRAPGLSQRRHPAALSRRGRANICCSTGTRATTATSWICPIAFL